MNLQEILNEGREAPLYHGMQTQKAMFVLSNDILPAGWEHDIPGIGRVKGNSLSRNKLLKYGYVILTFDQQKLSQTNKIVPVDGEYVHRVTTKLPTNVKSARDRNQIDMYGQKKEPKHALSEEFVIGDIKPLHKYLLNISIAEPDFGNEVLNKNKLSQITKICQTYCSKWNIQFSK
jgi:hypothetical protein